MSELFGVDRTRITRHINNIYNEEKLDKNSTCAENAHMGTLGVQRYSYKLYNLDMIISVSYRVKSQRGITFRKWANKVLKEYLIQGYSISNKRLEKLNKVIDIQNKMLASALKMQKM